MADVGISTAQLAAINTSLGRLANNLSTVAKNVDYVAGQVNVVDNKVESVSSDLDTLAREFQAFVDESKRVAALADAKQNVVMLEQELEKEYGHYDTVRKHTVGILQASDISVVRKETVANATEELMLQAPRYWLAPALIALSAWLSDKRDLAERALKEAMRRDDEKTSLLFCLISRRAGRLDGSLVWLERYFGMQDPKNMDRRVIVILDAFASGLFGADAKGLCSEKIKEWLDELSAKPGFVEEQKQQWSDAIVGRTADVDDSQFPYLVNYSPTWPQLKAVLAWAVTHGDIHAYFSTIFNTPVDNMASIAVKVDEILDNLVENYDDEELPIRQQVRKNHLVIEENGDLIRANARFDSEKAAYEKCEDFSQHLTSVALAPESSGALVATQKLAISLSKQWIINAYEDLTTASRAQVPHEIAVQISDWNGVTEDGSNEEELCESLASYVEAMKREALAKIKWFGPKIVIAIIIGAIVALAGLATIVLPLLAIAGVLVFVYFERKKADTQRKATIQQLEDFKESSMECLRATLAEVVDYRRLWSEKDCDYNKVMDFLGELTPEQYIAVVESQKTRQILH